MVVTTISLSARSRNGRWIIRKEAASRGHSRLRIGPSGVERIWFVGDRTDQSKD